MASIKYWLFLLCSILFEVSGTSIMKMAQTQDNTLALATGMAAMYLLLALSYVFLARAVVRLPIGVAYAFWEGIGLVLITAVSVLFLGEQLGAAKAGALVLILGGAFLVHHGTVCEDKEIEKDNLADAAGGKSMSSVKRGLQAEGGVS